MTDSDLNALRIGLIGPLPPPSGGMANQTRQLGELLAAAGAQVTTVQVNAPYRPSWIGRVPLARSVFRLLPYLSALWRAAGKSDVFHVMANSGWSWHLFAAPAVWVARSRGVAVVVNYRGGEAAEFLQGSAALVRFTMRRVAALVVPSGFLQGVFQRFGMQAEIVPNIIDLSRFAPREAARALGKLDDIGGGLINTVRVLAWKNAFHVQDLIPNVRLSLLAPLLGVTLGDLDGLFADLRLFGLGLQAFGAFLGRLDDDSGSVLDLFL